jgi:hypothetical protein
MKMSKRLTVAVGGGLTLWFFAHSLQPTSAIPVFARKYGFDCTMCHVQFPKLNDFGQRFRDNGYQVPGQEDMDQAAVDTLPSLAARTSVGYVSHSVRRTPNDEPSKEFNVGGLDMLAGGLFKKDIGFFAIYTPRLDPARGSGEQEGKLEMANVVFNRLGSNPKVHLSLRVGRFEPGFLGTSAKRSFTFSGYEAYDFEGATGGANGGFAWSDTQEGLEVSAHGPNGWHGMVGWVNGSQNHGSDQSPKDFYLRVYKVFGAGEGQTAGHRAGLAFYCGRARPGDAVRGPQYSFHRIGVDASLNARNTNVMLQYLRGSDDRGFLGGPSDADWKGGFLEVNHTCRPDLIGFARYDWVSVPATLGPDIRAWVIGSRWNLEKNLAAHLEYCHRKADETVKDLYLRLDMAF